MTNRTDVAFSREIVARWCSLAEQRLEYLTELFETGRWRRYHSELAFLENISEAKRAVELWRDLSGESRRNDFAIDISPSAGSWAPLSDDDGLSDQVVWLQPQPMEIPAELPLSEVSMEAEAEGVSSDEAPYAPVEDDASEMTMDIAAMQERYPSLRNALL
jgi:uncharacterized repeat protein (TIGR03809 family)